MRVYLMLSHDVVFNPGLLRQILRRLPAGDVVGVAEVRPKPAGAGGYPPPVGTLAFWGCKGAGILATHVMAKKMLSALPVPDHFRRRATIKRVCASHGIPYRNVSDVNERDLIDDLMDMRLDVIVSFQDQIFRDALLAVPRLACVNCHPAALPGYRGVKPIFWAMKNDEPSFGVTVHTMQRAIDTGRVVSQRFIPIDYRDSLLQHYFTAYEVAGDVIVDALTRLRESPDLSSLPEITADAPYWGSPTSEDVAEFRRSGKRTA